MSAGLTNGVAGEESANLSQESDPLPEDTHQVGNPTDIAELWQKWAEAGEKATDQARTDLQSKGIGFVFKDQNGHIVEQSPSGSVKILPSTK